MYWLGTNTGNVIDLNNPAYDQITIEDIATGLSNICRFNGQIKRFYSVADHCVNVASLVPKKYKAAALLHDASEAFICDIPTPLKRYLGDTYLELEERIQEIIGRRFDVELTPLADTIKEADKIMAVSERDQFTERPLTWSFDYENAVRYPGVIPRSTNPSDAKARFMKAFAEYYT